MAKWRALDLARSEIKRLWGIKKLLKTKREGGTPFPLAL
jgi:hypothetical protein